MALPVSFHNGLYMLYAIAHKESGRKTQMPAMYRRSGESIDNTILRPYRSEPLEHKYLL